MYFTKEALQQRNTKAQWDELWAKRRQHNLMHDLMVNQLAPAMSEPELQANALGGFGMEFWAELDRNVLESRGSTTGMELVDDLLTLQTPLSVGKTLRLYSISGDIADDVSVTIDGQAPYSFDHVDYDKDGDPIPVFTAGYGVNWRLAEGARTMDIDLVLDSQNAKVDKYHKRLVHYMLNGDANISVQGYKAQGIKNHRNTSKVNLGPAGAGIDLTTATPAEVVEFFTKGAFGQNRIANLVDYYGVLWVSQEIGLNIDGPYIEGGVRIGTIREAIMARGKVREIRESFALKGNEFIAYEKTRNAISPLVGMATGVVPLPRPLPQTNFNFQIMGAYGLQITADDEKRSGVVYGANLA